MLAKPRFRNSFILPSWLAPRHWKTNLTPNPILSLVKQSHPNSQYGDIIFDQRRFSLTDHKDIIFFEPLNYSGLIVKPRRGFGNKCMMSCIITALKMKDEHVFTDLTLHAANQYNHNGMNMREANEFMDKYNAKNDTQFRIIFVNNSLGCVLLPYSFHYNENIIVINVGFDHATLGIITNKDEVSNIPYFYTKEYAEKNISLLKESTFESWFQLYWNFRLFHHRNLVSRHAAVKEILLLERSLEEKLITMN